MARRGVKNLTKEQLSVVNGTLTIEYDIKRTL